ncbi:hypothetical protein HYR69_07600 [Candidatus Sumerlaeota bacterium]|nr:hypothetical protein [Candidatus Sumerlaeota bacterium]
MAGERVSFYSNDRDLGGEKQVVTVVAVAMRKGKDPMCCREIDKIIKLMCNCRPIISLCLLLCVACRIQSNASTTSEAPEATGLVSLSVRYSDNTPASYARLMVWSETAAFYDDLMSVYEHILNVQLDQDGKTGIKVSPAVMSNDIYVSDEVGSMAGGVIDNARQESWKAVIEYYQANIPKLSDVHKTGNRITGVMPRTVKSVEIETPNVERAVRSASLSCLYLVSNEGCHTTCLVMSEMLRVRSPSTFRVPLPYEGGQHSGCCRLSESPTVRIDMTFEDRSIYECLVKVPTVDGALVRCKLEYIGQSNAPGK